MASINALTFTEADAPKGIDGSHILKDHSSLSLRLSGYSSIALRIEDSNHPLGVWVSVVGGISIAVTAIALSSLSGEYR